MLTHYKLAVGGLINNHGAQMSPAGHNEICRLKFHIGFLLFTILLMGLKRTQETIGRKRQDTLIYIVTSHLHYKGFTVHNMVCL